MNLIENIQRIKEMMGIITESVSDIKSILKIGSNGGEVEALQDLLGIYKDGNFGEQTKTCVQEFQKKMEIYDDGIVGNITKSKLKDLEDNKVE
jgi:peptidoglycan hydrolase-like protein with peptidoglycan-binding domain